MSNIIKDRFAGKVAFVTGGSSGPRHLIPTP